MDESRARAYADVPSDELHRRALGLISRIRKVRSPLVGIPLAPGHRPFVVRRDLLEGQTKDLSELKVGFNFTECDYAVLEIEGKFGKGGIHRSRLVDVSTHREAFDGHSVKGALIKWAGQQKAKPKVSTADPSVKRQSRVDAKLRKIDESIAKLLRKIKELGESRPTNPLVADPDWWDSESERREWICRGILRYRAEKSRRRRVSKLVAQNMAPPKIVKKHVQRGLWDVEVSEDTPPAKFQWATFYAALSAADIEVRTVYAKAHPRKDGPKIPTEYLRDMSWFGLSKNKNSVGIDAENHLSEYLVHHADARRDYIAVLRERKSLESMIEGLQEVRRGLVESASTSLSEEDSLVVLSPVEVVDSELGSEAA